MTQTADTHKKPGLLKRFLAYYRPHMKIFSLDMCASLLVSLIGIVYPIVTRTMLNDLIPNRNYRMVVVFGLTLLCLYMCKMGLNFFIQYYGQQYDKEHVRQRIDDIHYPHHYHIDLSAEIADDPLFFELHRGFESLFVDRDLDKKVSFQLFFQKLCFFYNLLRCLLRSLYVKHLIFSDNASDLFYQLPKIAVFLCDDRRICSNTRKRVKFIAMSDCG